MKLISFYVQTNDSGCHAKPIFNYFRQLPK